MQITQNEPEGREQQDAQIRHLTPAEVASRLGVSVSTIRRHAPALGRKQFGRWLIDPAKLAELTGEQQAAVA